MSAEMIAVIALIVAIAVGIVAIILYKRNVISGDAIGGIAEVLQALPVTVGSGLFGKILEYSRTAVLTVEQLVKSGKLRPDDETRKDMAMRIVEKAAKVDEVPFGALESEAASACIEACVQELPRNYYKKVNDGASV